MTSITTKLPDLAIRHSERCQSRRYDPRQIGFVITVYEHNSERLGVRTISALSFEIFPSDANQAINGVVGPAGYRADGRIKKLRQRLDQAEFLRDCDLGGRGRAALHFVR
jgi:hypothetical protein